MGDLPEDPGRWVDLGRLLGRLGWTEASATAMAKARSLLERRLARAPDDEAAAAGLIGVIPDAGDCRRLDYPPARDDDLRRGCDADPAARRLGPGGGPNSGRRHLHGRGHDRPLRDHRGALEAMPDPRLPASDPDAIRPSGTFVLRRIPPEHAPRAGGRTRVHLTRVLYSMPSGRSRAWSGAVDADQIPGWSAFPRDRPASLGRLPGRSTDRARRRDAVARGAGLRGQRVADSDAGPVPPVGHGPPVPAFMSRPC